MSTWSEYAVWWQLHPLTFLGAIPAAPTAVGDATVEHRLDGLEPWLDYLVELGCNGLALGPIFASESHGYDTTDHYRIDPKLGTDEDFARLVERCRARGVRLLLDGVFNHVGRGFPAFRDVLEHGRASRYASWFRTDFDEPGTDGDGFAYACFEGHRHLVALNHAEPEVREYVSGVMRHWLERGADGWRLDAAYAVPHDFWHETIGRVRGEGHQNAWFVGEYIHGDYTAAVREGALDSVTQYELWKAIWSSLNDGNFFELAWALDRHNGYTDAQLPLTFVGNHDVTRLASRLEDERCLPHALAILLTVAGIPSIYAGDEQAFRGVKYERADGDAEIRPAFPPQGPAGLAPHGRPVFRLHQDLIGLRRRHPWLVRARTRVLRLEKLAFAYEVRDPDGDAALAVLLNLADREQVFPVGPAGARRILASRGSGWNGLVEAHGWAILDLRP
ncbi:alpha-amylase family protein [Actinocrinis puniceicyclus]|uniref:Alpha-amylase family protein n=1 Tax=Actinocrinis puniceicyclus TaxID=977794 RepID=A0A8J7WGB8_9ACTN|nr:alpha-amylase family protein [Actinocrinis puniceicyclus]MBS2961601.1 alpha-amylase family protein [Actinocrinis puniceicyclus]